MQKRNTKVFLLLFLGILSSFSSFVLDLYLPAIPSMVDYFSQTKPIVQLTLTTSMIGLALGQIIIGPISDKFGRKKPLTISLIVCLCSTILILLSTNIYIIIALRFIQGFSAAGGLVISRAAATDLFDGQEMAKFFSSLMTVNGFIPITAPILGGLSLQLGNWHGIFITITIILLLFISASFSFKETLPSESRAAIPILKTFSNIAIIFKNKVFIMVMLIQCFSLSAMFSYVAASPFIFQSHYKLSPVIYSLCLSLNGLGIVLGNKCSGYFNSKNGLYIGVALMLIASIYLAIVLPYQLAFVLVEIGFFLLLLGLGFVLPTSLSLAMNLERHRAGSASALFGFAPFFLGGFISPLVSLGNIFYSAAIAIIICTTGSLILLKLVNKKL